MERVINESGRTADNDDMLFFRSLLPHVSNIPQDMKMRFRNKVQLLVDEFAYGSNSAIQTSYLNAQPTPLTSQYSTLSSFTQSDDNSVNTRLSTSQKCPESISLLTYIQYN